MILDKIRFSWITTRILTHHAENTEIIKFKVGQGLQQINQRHTENLPRETNGCGQQRQTIQDPAKVTAEKAIPLLQNLMARKQVNRRDFQKVASTINNC